MYAISGVGHFPLDIFFRIAPPRTIIPTDVSPRTFCQHRTFTPAVSFVSVSGNLPAFTYLLSVIDIFEFFVISNFRLLPLLFHFQQYFYRAMH